MDVLPANVLVLKTAEFCTLILPGTVKNSKSLADNEEPLVRWCLYVMAALVELPMQVLILLLLFSMDNGLLPIESLAFEVLF